jgi:hypothetical protein
LGTNHTIDDLESRQAPKAIFFGGDFSVDEFEQVKAAVAATTEKNESPIHLIQVHKRDVLATGAVAPNPDVITDIYRKKWQAAVEASG